MKTKDYVNVCVFELKKRKYVKTFVNDEPIYSKSILPRDKKQNKKTLYVLDWRTWRVWDVVRRWRYVIFDVVRHQEQGSADVQGTSRLQVVRPGRAILHGLGKVSMKIMIANNQCTTTFNV